MVSSIYILLCIIWGSTWIMIKIGLEDSPPLTAAALRFILVVAIFLTIAKLRKSPFPKTWLEMLKRAYPGLYMYGGGYALVYFAEMHISSSLTAVLFASFPLFVAILAALMFKQERTTSLMWVGLALGLGGIVVISVDTLNVSGDLFLGTILALASSLASAYGMMLHKKFFVQDDIFVSAGLQTALGGLPLILAAFVFEDVGDFRITQSSVSSILFLAVFGSVIAFAGYYWLLARISAVGVSFIAFITPLVAILIGVGLAGEQLTMPTVYGAVLILGGIALVIRR